MTGPGARWRRIAGHGHGVIIAMLLVVGGGTLVACEPALREETGVLVSLDSPALGTVQGFELRTADGRTITFDTQGLAFDRAGFPAAHLSEHLATAEPVRVTFRVEGGRNVVVRLTDAPG